MQAKRSGDGLGFKSVNKPTYLRDPCANSSQERNLDNRIAVSRQWNKNVFQSLASHFRAVVAAIHTSNLNFRGIILTSPSTRLNSYIWYFMQKKIMQQRDLFDSDRCFCKSIVTATFWYISESKTVRLVRTNEWIRTTVNAQTIHAAECYAEHKTVAMNLSPRFVQPADSLRKESSRAAQL